MSPQIFWQIKKQILNKIWKVILKKNGFIRKNITKTKNNNIIIIVFPLEGYQNFFIFHKMAWQVPHLKCLTQVV